MAQVPAGTNGANGFTRPLVASQAYPTLSNPQLKMLAGTDDNGIIVTPWW